MKLLFKIPVVFTVAIISLTVGCTKTRKAKLADGDGRYSDSVAQYDNKVFKVQTLQPIGTGGLISSSEEATAATDEKSPIKTFPAVKYKTDAKLVDSVPFLAQPNTSNVYEIHYNLTNTHLVISKVAPENYIPFQEKTYADKLPDGRLSVPLFGYPIVGKVSREVAKNDLGEKTSRLVERPVNDIKQASHIQIDFSRIEEFGAIKKIDTFPVAYFTGEKNETEWYYGETILSTPDPASTAIGSSSTFSTFNVKQSVVRFDRNQNGLEVVGLVVDDKAKDNQANYQRVAFIPGEYKDFKVEKDGRFKKLKEEQETSDNILWKNNKFIKLDFSKLISQYSTRKTNTIMDDEDSIPEANRVDLAGLKVVSIKLEDNYMSIIVENAASNVRLHLSFLKKNKLAKKYVPLAYHEADNRQFGYFATMAPSLTAMDYRSRRNSDLEKQYYVKRFDPAKKVIEFYVTKSTPDWAIPAAEKSIQSWNQAFKQANTGIEIRFNNSKKVETGDIRYNVLNLIDAKGIGNNGSLFGYGPSLSDPFTGEVISAISTVHLHNMRLSLIYDIRGYVLSKAGILPDYFGKGSNGLQEIILSATQKIFSLFSDVKSPNVETDKFEQLNGFASPRENFLNELNTHRKYFTEISKMSNRTIREKIIRSSAPEFAVPVVMENMEEDLRANCPEVISYISSIKGKDVRYIDEIPVIEKCAEKLLVDASVPTIVHEMGHNFGLRHNFAGSADYNNFYADSSGNPTVNTSSIMDYVPMSYRKLSVPGKYDVAAIRYGYAGQIQLNHENGDQLVNLDLKKDIPTNLEIKNISTTALKPYKFCTDYEAYVGFNNPMCAIHDVGYTPALVIDYHMEQANKIFALGQFKFDRSRIRSHSTQYMAFYQHVHPMMVYYAHWREKLAEYMGKKNIYLESQTPDSYAGILANMQKDPKYADFYNTYKPIVDRIFKFLLTYSFLSDRFCLVEKADSSLDLIEFSKVHRKTYGHSKASVKSCMDPEAKNYLATIKLNPLGEFGYSTVDIRYDISDEGQTTSLPNSYVSPDVLSSAPVKEIAIQALTQRVAYTQKGWEMGMFPSMLDEPQYREEILKRVMDRAINGLNAEKMSEYPEVKPTLEKLGLKDRFAKSILSKRFLTEKQGLNMLMFYTKMGLNIPGNFNDSIERSKLVGGSVGRADNGPGLAFGLSYMPGPEAIYSRQILMKYQANITLSEMSPSDVETIVDMVKGLGLPQTEEEAKKMTIKEFTAKLNVMYKFLAEQTGGDKEALPKIMSMVGSLFPSLVDVSEDLQNYNEEAAAELSENKEVLAISDKKEQQKRGQEIANQMMNRPAFSIMKKFKPFNVEQKVKEVYNMLEEMKNNSDEISAQQDLFLRFMLAY
jgi:hypothetical protein